VFPSLLEARPTPPISHKNQKKDLIPSIFHPKKTNIKMHISLLPISLLVARALADGAAIVAAMTTIGNATVKLNSTVSSFPDNPLLDLLDVGGLLTDSISLLNDINAATHIAQASANLTLLEAISVAQSTISLASMVESTLTNIVNSKPKFDKLVVVSPVILLNLKSEKGATDSFGAAVVAKVPAALQATAQNLLAPIDDAFNSAIATYGEFAL
jgi:Hydrophobic surface binding protein A